MKKQTFSLLLALLMLTAVSCGDSTQTRTDTPDTISPADTDTASNTVTLLSDTLAENDYNGSLFRIFGETQAMHGDYFTVENETGDVIEDNVYRRNSMTEEKYNIELDFYLVDQGAGKNMITTYIQSGDNSITLFTNTYLNLGALLVQNYFVDWTQIETVDLSLPCYVQEAIETFSIGDKTPLLFGDFMETNILRCWNFLFNKRLIEEYDLPSPYDAVDNNEWTLDYFREMIKDIAKDLNGDSIMNENDLFGFAADSLATLDAFTRSCDLSAIAKDENNLPVLDYFNENVVTAFEKIYELYRESSGSYVADESLWHIDNLFAKGNAIFAAGRIDLTMNSAIRAMEDTYGVVPYPKLDASIEGYPTYLSGTVSTQMVGVSQPEEAYDMIGTITQALNAYSYDFVTPAIYEITLKTKNTHDEDSIRMLDIILANRQYSFDACDEAVFPLAPNYSVRYLIGGQKTKDIASYYEKNEKKARKWVEDIIAAYED